MVSHMALAMFPLKTRTKDHRNLFPPDLLIRKAMVAAGSQSANSRKEAASRPHSQQITQETVSKDQVDAHFPSAGGSCHPAAHFSDITPRFPCKGRVRRIFSSMASRYAQIRRSRARSRHASASS